MTTPVTTPSRDFVVVARRESEAGARAAVRLLAGSGIESWIVPMQTGKFWRFIGARPWFAVGVAPAHVERAKQVIDAQAAA
jgi:hypothetical protein